MQKEFLSFDELLSILSISKATANNWIRLGKLEVCHINGRKVFKRESIQKILNGISDGSTKILQNRRNKKHINGRSVYENYVEFSTKSVKTVKNILGNKKHIFTDSEIRYIITELALKIIVNHEKIAISSTNFTESYLSGELRIGKYASLIDDLLFNTFPTDCGKQIVERFKDIRPRFIKGHDFLGFVYISLKNLGNRKALGTYYTPNWIVKKSVENLKNYLSKDKKILDPCCGTGNFLIHLNKYIDSPDQIYGSDIDLLSVQITRLNIALHFDIKNISLLYQNITHRNSLTDPDSNTYDIILGNPPWGYSFTNEERLKLSETYSTAKCKTPESYDIFTEYAIKTLKNGSILSFVLPEAILNVHSHKTIRQIIINNCSFQKISYLGDVFSGVQCPSVILNLKKSDTPTVKGCKIETEKQTFTIKKTRNLNANAICLNSSDSQQRCIDKIESLSNTFTLKNNAVFALGIITGNNKNFISNTQTQNNEIILRGSDINKYTFNTPNRFIEFKPQTFQQSAPVEFYRAKEKILYRFICNSPVFCYDNQQTLSLNSCNLLIPKVPEINIKYILAILNSSVSAFYFKTKFNSLKFLRSHIEQFPIPFPDKTIHTEIVEKVNLILANHSDSVQVFNELDEIIMKLYKLSNRDTSIILKTIEPQNIFIK